MTGAATARMSQPDLLDAWERGSRGTPAERAIALVAQATGEPAAVEDWTVGRRDAGLLDLHEAAFGPLIEAVTPCPECAEPQELAFAISEVRAPFGDAGREHELDHEASGLRLTFRLPSSRDLRAAALADDALEARCGLLEQCVLSAVREGEPVAAASLPDGAVAALGERIALHDPQADIELALSCTECGRHWQVRFDPADYLWRKVDRRARTLLAEIAALARAFGWSEQEILALPDSRRQHYLDLVGA
jgi:hypothetical protein